MIQIVENDNGTFTFHLKTENNIILLQGAIFSSKEEIEAIIKTITTSLHDQGIFERKTATTGKFLFNLKSLEGKVIGTSQLYSSEAGMENGIKNFKTSMILNTKL
ncbi:YegP family protein [Cellulophaga sp. F20128]|uniref:YegP family protein n=1 Tax=Cellulophaga sp. F20128 TaxID=2926413 RepID=UPI001FF4F2E0|nr:YegP family protein [Cellulophaga sp. F20128]MCK0156659.1 YegP family protein [Cellulophaga sp. F20128]